MYAAAVVALLALCLLAALAATSPGRARARQHALRRRRLDLSGACPLPPAPFPPRYPCQRFDPGRSSSVTGQLRWMVREGLQRSAFTTSLPYLKDASGVVHYDSSCPGVQGDTAPSPRSPLSLPVALTCRCADEAVESVQPFAGAFESASTLLSLRREVREGYRGNDPVQLAASVKLVEESLREAEGRSLPETASLAASLEREAQDALLELRSRLTSPEVRSRALELVAVETVVSMLSSRQISPRRLAPLVAHGEDRRVLAALLDSWCSERSAGSALRASRCSVAEAASWVSPPTLDQLRFEPAAPRPLGTSLRSWVVSSWKQALEAALLSYVAEWEAEVVRLLGAPQGVLLGFEEFTFRVSDRSRLVLETFRVPAPEPVFYVPKPVDAWLRSEGLDLTRAGGVHRVLAPGLTDVEAETAAALWSPGQDGALKALSAALKAARLL